MTAALSSPATGDLLFIVDTTATTNILSTVSGFTYGDKTYTTTTVVDNLVIVPLVATVGVTISDNLTASVSSVAFSPPTSTS